MTFSPGRSGRKTIGLGDGPDSWLVDGRNVVHQRFMKRLSCNRILEASPNGIHGPAMYNWRTRDRFAGELGETPKNRLRIEYAKVSKQGNYRQANLLG